MGAGRSEVGWTRAGQERGGAGAGRSEMGRMRAGQE